MKWKHPRAVPHGQLRPVSNYALKITAVKTKANQRKETYFEEKVKGFF